MFPPSVSFFCFVFWVIPLCSVWLRRKCKRRKGIANSELIIFIICVGRGEYYTSIPVGLRQLFGLVEWR